MLRIDATVKKKHGAYAAFMARFRDAMFIVNGEDIEALKQSLILGGIMPFLSMIVFLTVF